MSEQTGGVKVGSSGGRVSVGPSLDPNHRYQLTPPQAIELATQILAHAHAINAVTMASGGVNCGPGTLAGRERTAAFGAPRIRLDHEPSAEQAKRTKDLQAAEAERQNAHTQRDTLRKATAAANQAAHRLEAATKEAAVLYDKLSNRIVRGNHVQDEIAEVCKRAGAGADQLAGMIRVARGVMSQDKSPDDGLPKTTREYQAAESARGGSRGYPEPGNCPNDPARCRCGLCELASPTVKLNTKPYTFQVFPEGVPGVRKFDL